MNIAIVGTGNVGGVLAQQLIKACHTVLMGAKFPLSEKSVRFAVKIGEDRFAAIEYAADKSEVIIIATHLMLFWRLIARRGNIEAQFWQFGKLKHFHCFDFLTWLNGLFMRNLWKNKTLAVLPFHNKS